MSTRRLSITTIATDNPMGAQAYQRQIMNRAAHALAEVEEREWSVREVVARSMRSQLPGDRRLPLARLAQASPSVRRAVGKMLFAGDDVTHRMALELPPGPRDVVTLHDVVAWRFPDESAPVAAAAEELKRAAAVICVSEFSAQEAIDLLGIRNPIVVHNGVDPRYFDAVPLDRAERKRLGLEEGFVLHLGGAAQRKNLDALAAAWPTVRRERPHLNLALAGPPHPRRTALFQGLPGVRMLGRLSDDVMPSLVASASAVVVPSLYEGFGLPVLEAMAANVPVVVANTSSLPEVAGGHGILVTPDAVAIAGGLIDATADSGNGVDMIDRAREHAAQFTWERSAAGHAQVWTSFA
ncbi:glycosyltransferase family 1 protein [Microbacterium sp. H1-D42]|uniref:glycosyltransferase family 4 protein n=1 Tax=Microbacterium sp. H1-D42 TaxID=2925844 RepID=UPI001F533D55|nr:glycosyltransferase family 1 protein [Microbacterium sp. H1-D42]UNK70148.1 glycosyltransferase family 4 protein [Microbacterium sp. H1-D42]